MPQAERLAAARDHVILRQMIARLAEALPGTHCASALRYRYKEAESSARVNGRGFTGPRGRQALPLAGFRATSPRALNNGCPRVAPRSVGASS